MLLAVPPIPNHVIDRYTRKVPDRPRFTDIQRTMMLQHISSRSSIFHYHMATAIIFANSSFNWNRYQNPYRTFFCYNLINFCSAVYVRFIAHMRPTCVFQLEWTGLHCDWDLLSKRTSKIWSIASRYMNASMNRAVYAEAHLFGKLILALQHLFDVSKFFKMIFIPKNDTKHQRVLALCDISVVIFSFLELSIVTTDRLSRILCREYSVTLTKIKDCCIDHSISSYIQNPPQPWYWL